MMLTQLLKSCKSLQMHRQLIEKMRGKGSDDSCTELFFFHIGDGHDVTLTVSSRTQMFVSFLHLTQLLLHNMIRESPLHTND